MKKRALRKDFYMEIRKSLGRFLSIFFIVALGVSFFSGIRASEPDMRISGDAYFDEKNLMDIKVISTMGLTKDDLHAIEGLSDVAKAEGGFSQDMLLNIDDNQKVLHVMSIPESMNELTVSEGRMPEKEGECLVDIDFLEGTSYRIGDTITLTGENSGILEVKEFKIVGTGSSPSYISFGRGSSLIGTGTVSGFLAVTDENFSPDTYTEIYVKAAGAKEETAFTEDVGLGERAANFPAQLSGGEQQRVSIARALAKNPKLLLCDEPTGALDYNTGKAILKLLQDTCRKKGMTVILITHNSAIAPMADRVIKIKNGKVSKVTLNENPISVETIEW